MFNLFKSDMYKLFRSKSLYICTFISILFVIFALFVYDLTYNMDTNNTSDHKDTSSNASSSETVSEAQTLDIADDISIQENENNDAKSESTDEKSMNGDSSGSIMGDILGEDIDLSGIYMLKDSFTNIGLFLGILISIFVTAEFSNGTMKNIASRGFSRWKIYLSKLLAIIFGNIFITAMTAASAIIAGTIKWKFGERSDHFIEDLARVFALELLVHTAICALFTMVAFIIRQNGPTIAVNLSIFSLASLLLQLLSLLFEKVFKSKFDINDYWILDYTSKVSSLTIKQDIINKSILVSVGYIVVTTVIGIFVFKKNDIK